MAAGPMLMADGAVDPADDLFPVEVEVEHSQKWSIEYFNSYKVVRNLHVGETYLLYQCGTEPPALDDTVDVTRTIEIPVQSIGPNAHHPIPGVSGIGRQNQRQ